MRTPTAVRTEVDTSLSDLAIEEILDRGARNIEREYDAADFKDAQHRRDFEAVLAALRIAAGRDRRARRVSSESRFARSRSASR